MLYQTRKTQPVASSIMSHWTMASNGPPSSMSRPLSASVTFKLAQGPQTLIKGLCKVAGLKTNSSRPGWGTSSQCPSFPRYLHWFQSLQSGDQCRVKVSFLSALGAALCYGDGLSQGPGLELNSAPALRLQAGLQQFQTRLAQVPTKHNKLKDHAEKIKN